MLGRAALLAACVALTSACVTFRVTENWGNGFKIEFTVSGDAALDGWDFNLKLNGIREIQADWVVDATSNGGDSFHVTNIGSNSHLDAGQTLTNMMVIFCSQNCDPNTMQITGDHTGGDCSHGGGSQGGTGQNPGGTQAPVGGGGSGSKDYGHALGLSVLFYDAQRSGRLPGNNPIPWRGDSALGDCVVGGWYDAGDHVKFGLPFGAATHILLWGMHKFMSGYEAANQVDMAFDMVKWATDYMLDAWNPGSHELVAQIGDGNADHAFWGRPEDMTMGRPCFKVGPGKPAADLMGEWAASLAAGYLVFKDRDAGYANRMLDAAKSMYAFAKSQPGTYTNSVPNVGSFYGSTGFRDEMCLGGVWLYKATGEAGFLNDAKGYHDGGTAWALSWDDKKVACQLLLFEETNDASYKGDVQAFLRDYMPGGSVPYTPCGLAWRDRWGANRYAGNAAWVALAAADAGIMPGEAAKFGVEQLNYLLGDNHHDGGCYSYEIGYGSKFPHHPHHRAASTTGQQLNGALVGGPDQGDNYGDRQDDYVMNEVAIDYNAGFHSALAAASSLAAAGNLPATNNRCPC